MGYGVRDTEPPGDGAGDWREVLVKRKNLEPSTFSLGECTLKNGVLGFSLSFFFSFLSPFFWNLATHATSMDAIRRFRFWIIYLKIDAAQFGPFYPPGFVFLLKIFSFYHHSFSENRVAYKVVRRDKPFNRFHFCHVDCLLP